MGIRKILPLSCLLFLLLGGATSTAADRLPEGFGKINWESTEAARKQLFKRLTKAGQASKKVLKTEQLKGELSRQKKEAHYGELVDGLTQVLEIHFDSAAWRQGFQGHCRMTQCKKKKRRTSAASRKACRALCDRKIAASCKRTVADVRKYIARNKKEMRRLSTELGPRFSPRIVNQLSNRLSRLMPACGKRSLALNKLIRPVLPAPLR